VKRYAPEETDWTVTSEVMMSHQRGGANANNRINDFLLEEYGKPKDFQSFIYMSQLLQADAIKMAMEAHRRDMPYCMGSLVWQHNDCWPVASWSSRDYYGRWKAQHYFTVKSFADMLISPIEEEGIIKLYGVSDRLKKTSGTLSVQVIDLDKGFVSESKHNITIPANSSTLCRQENVNELLKGISRKEVVIHLEYKVKDGTVYENNLFLAKHKEIHFPQVTIDRQITAVNGGYDVTLTADKFARAVFISLEGKDDFIKDNYIDLLPGKAVTINVQTNLLPAAFEKHLKVVSFVDAYGSF
jgi:beta-mannosidase